MRDRRFFATFALDAREFEIAGDEFFHVTKVMRAKKGDRIEVVNGRGAWCEAEILRTGTRSLSAGVIKKRQEERPPLQTVVAPSLCRSHINSWMMEKLAEIAVDQVRPIICERTETGRGISSRFSVGKWQKIAEQALKVNRRLWLTEIFPPLELDRMLAASDSCRGRFFLDTSGEMAKPREWDFPVTVLVGPPGDFSPREKERIRDRGFVGLKINEAILRTETAAVSIAAILKYD